MTTADELTHTKFLTCIIGSPRRAMLVRCYSQTGIRYSGRKRLWDLLRPALKGMINLKIVAFQSTEVSSSTGFHGEYPFLLEGLDFSGPYESDDHTLLEFLQLQSKLKQLDVEWGEEDKALILPSTCPNLDLLRGNRGAIEAFLPGRRITSLAWIPHPLDSHNDIDHLSRSFRNIKVLSFGGIELFERPDLNVIINHLQSVEILKLFDPSQEELYLLSRIPNLRILLMKCQFTRRHYPSPPFENLPNVIQCLFSTCRSLECIESSCDRFNYERWVRGRHSPQATLRTYKGEYP
ncbi:hypothetical protein GALMADRAFT_789969 [Galerina marginata CBS 339.88]|uniref:F-box domain-containing protein n=1 Tax=Galerina marginata (strain CBS 339.88) TaxID=685588 RepID=A0A067SV41_GALM3|nr:hypothetical protein GALMADRAFT_789969 [Galerina marginata CBS 339.88]